MRDACVVRSGTRSSLSTSSRGRDPPPSAVTSSIRSDTAARSRRDRTGHPSLLVLMMLNIVPSHHGPSRVHRRAADGDEKRARHVCRRPRSRLNLGQHSPCVQVTAGLQLVSIAFLVPLMTLVHAEKDARKSRRAKRRPPPPLPRHHRWGPQPSPPAVAAACDVTQAERHAHPSPSCTRCGRADRTHPEINSRDQS